MRKLVFCAFLTVSFQNLYSQNTESFGIFGGFNIPITIDKGLDKDPRYQAKFHIRGTPIGLYYGYDRPGFGYVISPSYLQIGQTYTIVNTTGGDVGTRDISMNYFSLPVALKFHLNDLSFFRLSAIAAVDFCFLMDGKEVINMEAGKLRYPAGVTIPPDYIIAYDGVFVPKIIDQVYVSKDKMSSFQLFGGIGLRADLDLNENWGVMMDGRANFGLFDSRNTAYLEELQNPTGGPDVNGNPGAPDLYGQRRDVFLSVSFGVSRIIQTKKEFKERHSSPLPKVNYSKTVGGKKKPKK